jgi:hypothetical protein
MDQGSVLVCRHDGLVANGCHCRDFQGLPMIGRLTRFRNDLWRICHGYTIAKDAYGVKWWVKS